MHQRKTATRSSDFDVRDAHELAGPPMAASMGKPLVTAILLASGTLCLSGIAASLLPSVGGDVAALGERHPVAVTLRAPAQERSEHPTPLRAPTAFEAEPLLPRALERLAVRAAEAVARLEQRLDEQRVVADTNAPLAYATPAYYAPPTTHATVVAPAAESRRIVYLVDASGSLLDSLPQVIDWLGESLDSLGHQHTFTVLFFREGQVFEAPPRGLKPGSFAAKASVWMWVQPERGNVIPQGRSDLFGAVEMAMAYEPDELFVVSDDSFNRSTRGRTRDTALIDGLGARLGAAPPKVNTVQFFYRDEAGALEAIADRFRGTYTFVAPAERNTTAAGDPLLELSIVN